MFNSFVDTDQPVVSRNIAFAVIKDGKTIDQILQTFQLE